MSMNEYQYTFCGIPLRVVMCEEVEVPDTPDCPGEPRVDELVEIIMPDGDNCGTEYFSAEYVQYIEKQVQLKRDAEAENDREEQAVERHYNREEWSHARRPQP